MTLKKLKQDFLFSYDASQLSIAKSNLASREIQLENCERSLLEAKTKEDLIKSILVEAKGHSICLSAALEWQCIKEEILKLNGKSVKLHKEMANLKNQIRRLQSLHAWAKDGN